LEEGCKTCKETEIMPPDYASGAFKLETLEIGEGKIEISCHEGASP
jgi:hypothetical protein